MNISRSRWRLTSRSASRRPAGVSEAPRYGSYATSSAPLILLSMAVTDGAVTPSSRAISPVPATPSPASNQIAFR